MTTIENNKWYEIGSFNISKVINFKINVYGHENNPFIINVYDDKNIRKLSVENCSEYNVSFSDMSNKSNSVLYIYISGHKIPICYSSIRLTNRVILPNHITTLRVVQYWT